MVTTVVVQVMTVRLTSRFPILFLNSQLQGSFHFKAALLAIGQKAWYQRHVIIILRARGVVSIQKPSYQYRNSQYNGKTVSRPFYLYNGTPYTGKSVFILKQRSLPVPFREHRRQSPCLCRHRRSVLWHTESPPSRPLRDLEGVDSRPGWRCHCPCHTEVLGNSSGQRSNSGPVGNILRSGRSAGTEWSELGYQKRVSRTWIGNCISRLSVGCNYLSMT